MLGGVQRARGSPKSPILGTQGSPRAAAAAKQASACVVTATAAFGAILTRKEALKACDDMVA